MRMWASITGFERGATEASRGLRRDRLRQAMEDSLQIILQSTHVGYVDQKSPDGTPWAPNAPWWSEMKGNAAPNTGPVSKTVQGGIYKGLKELSRVNPKRMRNSLVKENNITSGSVHYDQEADERARATQFGGEGQIRLVPIAGTGPAGSEMVFDVQCIERPHLGIATYARIPPRTDAEWVEYYFGEQVEIQLRDDF